MPIFFYKLMPVKVYLLANGSPSSCCTSVLSYLEISILSTAQSSRGGGFLISLGQQGRA